MKFQVTGMPATKEFQRNSAHDYQFAVVQYDEGKPVKAVAYSANRRNAEATRNAKARDTAERETRWGQQYGLTYRVHAIEKIG